MRQRLVLIAASIVAVFAVASVASFDWRTVLGPSGAGLNAAGESVRTATGFGATPEKVVIAPGAQSPSGGAKGGQPPAPLVTVSKPIVREIVEWDEYTARMDAMDAVDVRARISGYLNEVRFKDGEDVKQGDLLFLIDPRPFERALDQARAELEAATTKSENARLDVDRGKPLVDRRVMSEKTFDDRASALRDAQATIKVAESKVKTAELELSFTRMAAPISGRIGRSLSSPGNYVNGAGANNSTLLTTIVSQNPIHVYFDVSENNLLKYKRLREQGQKTGASALGSVVHLALPDEQGYKHFAQLDFVDNRLDQATASIKVRAVLDNAQGLFSPGMFARVRIAATPPHAGILLPDEAILSDQASKYIYTVTEDGTAVRKGVVLGPLFDKLRVVRSGVVAEDWVVTKGLQRARPGLKVTPKRESIKVSEAGGDAQPARQ